MRKLLRLLVALFGLAALAAVLVWRWPRGPGREGAPHPGGAGTAAPIAQIAPAPPATARGDAAPAHPAERQRVRRLAPEDRRRLGEQIAAAVRRARAAPRAPGGAAPAADEDPIIPLEQAGEPLRQALQESIPILAECYPQPTRSGAAALARMTMVSDPELGTVIDTGEITDAGGAPLDGKLDDCLRDAIDALALPPLGVPGKLQLQYSFRFE
jgi:hypothetical protein